MTTKTQYNPNHDLNSKLLDCGASKTVYALITPETEATKADAMGYGNRDAENAFFNQFREAWTGKQDAYHREFFDEWYEWSKPVVDFDRAAYPFTYPTAGASEALRHLIFDFAAKGGTTIHVFEGEYEGYKAMGEAAGLKVVEWSRDDQNRVAGEFTRCYLNDLFFISQPSAIDGNVWQEFNRFIAYMPSGSVVVDVTYVGAVPQSAINERFNLNASAIRAIVFSLSKPFGAYYDRIGGVFMRQEDAGLFGNMWFKSLTALSIGRGLMARHDVFAIPTKYADVQKVACLFISEELKIAFKPRDVFILAGSDIDTHDEPMRNYLRRAGSLRVCLTKAMATIIGTAGDRA